MSTCVCVCMVAHCRISYHRQSGDMHTNNHNTATDALTPNVCSRSVISNGSSDQFPYTLHTHTQPVVLHQTFISRIQPHLIHSSPPPPSCHLWSRRSVLFLCVCQSEMCRGERGEERGDRGGPAGACRTRQSIQPIRAQINLCLAVT